MQVIDLGSGVGYRTPRAVCAPSEGTPNESSSHREPNKEKGKDKAIQCRVKQRVAHIDCV